MLKIIYPSNNVSSKLLPNWFSIKNYYTECIVLTTTIIPDWKYHLVVENNRWDTT